VKRALLPVLACVLPAAAGPLPASYIPPDAQWVVHVDIEKGLRSSIGSYVTAHPGEFAFDGVEAIRATTGINPLADIKDVTVFGSGCDPEQGVALVHTTGAVDAFLDAARKKESTFAPVTHGAYTLDSWTEAGSTRFGFVRSLGENERLILVAQDADRLAAAIARTERPAAVAGENALLAHPPKGSSVVFVAARGLGSMASNPKTMMLQQAEALVLDLGEEEGFLYADLSVTTHSPQDAQDLLAAINGCVALARIGARRDPELAGLLAATSGLSLSTSEATVRGQIRVESTKAIDMLKEAAARERRQKGNRSGPDRAPDQPRPAGEAPQSPPQRL
jgi:hypothetical protein